MNIEITTESLMKVCRICLEEGELNLWEYKVKLPPNDEKPLEKMPEEETTVHEMMKVFGKWEHNILDLSSELQLLCYDCLSELVPCYMYYKKLEQANEQVTRLFREALRMETELNSEEEVEFLEDSNDEDNASQNEQVVENEDRISSEIDTDEEELKEFTKICKEEAQIPETPPKQLVVKRRTVKNPKFILTGGVKKMLTHATNNEMPQKRYATTASPPKRQKMQRVAKTQQWDNIPINASLVVTQFIPSAAQISMETPLQPNATEQEGHSSDALPTNELRTMDYAAVEIKGDHIKEIIEDALNIQAASTPAEFLENETSEQTQQPLPLPVYACKYCPQAFSAPRYLMTHVRKSHVCQFCTMAFVKNADLYEHIKSAHQEHKCAICGKVLSSHSNLRGHIKRVHGLKLPAQVALLDYRPNATNEDDDETDDATDSQSEHRGTQQQYIVGEQG